MARYALRFLGGAVPLGGGVTTNNMAGTESLVGTDLLGVTTQTILAESNTGSDQTIFAASALFSEANTGSDSVGVTASASLEDRNSASEQAIQISATLLIESNTGSDSGGNQQSGVDGTSGADLALFISDPSPGFVESNTASDAASAGLTPGGTTNAMGGTDSLVGTDLLQGVSLVVLSETNTGSDQTIWSASALLVETNTGSDLGGNQQGGVDATPVLDAISQINTTLLIENNVGVDLIEAFDQASFVESNTASDAASAGLTPGGATNVMGGTDSLVGTDLLQGVLGITLFSDSNIASDQMSVTGIVTGIDLTAASDVGGIEYWIIESVVITESSGGLQSWGVDVTSGVDAIFIVESFAGEEAIVGIESGGMTTLPISTFFATLTAFVPPSGSIAAIVP